jgi:hypothetical protein
MISRPVIAAMDGSNTGIEAVSDPRSVSHAPSPVELSEKMKRKAAMRAAKLKSSSWYARAMRSISIVKQ